MQYTHLGRSGVAVSRLCLGTMNLGVTVDERESLAIMDRALELGINFFDTADVYSNGASEEVLGKALREIGVDRDDVVIATKCNGGTHNRARNRFGLSRKNVLESCDAAA